MNNKGAHKVQAPCPRGLGNTDMGSTIFLSNTRKLVNIAIKKDAIPVSTPSISNTTAGSAIRIKYCGSVAAYPRFRQNNNEVIARATPPAIANSEMINPRSKLKNLRNFFMCPLG